MYYRISFFDYDGEQIIAIVDSDKQKDEIINQLIMLNLFDNKIEVKDFEINKIDNKKLVDLINY